MNDITSPDALVLEPEEFAHDGMSVEDWADEIADCVMSVTEDGGIEFSEHIYELIRRIAAEGCTD